MRAIQNFQWVIAKRPGKQDKASRANFRLEACASPDPLKKGEIQVQLAYVSVDPTMRNFLAGRTSNALTDQTTSYYSYGDGWQVGKAPAGQCVATVVESADLSYAPGDMVSMGAPWILRSKIKAKYVGRIDKSLGIAPENYVSVLGGTGQAAYLPIKYIADAKPGEVAYVSAAAGSTGRVAVQILRLLGCEVVGSAGSAAKVRSIEALGAKAFNYKEEATLDALKRLCPKGVDIYFDCVGGPTLEAALECMKDFGRVIACGQISQYELSPEERYGVRNLFHIVAKRLRFQGFVTDRLSFTKAQFAEFDAQVKDWLVQGKLKGEHTFVDGFENIPDALLGLFEGANTGKMLVRIPASGMVSTCKL